MTRAAKLLPEVAEALAVVTAAPQRPLFPAIEVADTAKAIAARAAATAERAAKLDYLRREVERLERDLARASRDLRDAFAEEERIADRLDEARAALAKEEAPNGE